MRDGLPEAGRGIRAAVRALLVVPSFSAVATGSLVLTFALVTVTASVVNAYLVRSMPYPHADRLVRVLYAPPGHAEPGNLAALDWESLGAVVESADHSAPSRWYVRDGVEPSEITGVLVSPGSLDMLGVTASLGRSLRGTDFDAGAAPVMMIGHGFWQEHFGASPDAVGRTFRASPTLNEPEQAFRIVGVLPAGFRYAREYDRGEPQFVIPLTTPRPAYMVRLRAAATRTSAVDAITDAVRSVATSIPADWTGVRLVSVHEEYVASVRPILFSVAAGAVAVFVITCVNLAVLSLLRALRRQKEMAVRVALGARRGHLVRSIATESALVCGTAVAGGLVMSGGVLRVLAPVIEAQVGRDAPGGTAAIAIDWNVLSVVAGAGLLVVAILAFVPLLVPLYGSLAAAPQSLTRGASERPGMRRVRAGLIAAQVATSVTLLVGCGLMVRTVLNLIHTDLGFRTQNVARARIALPAATYSSPPALLRFYDALLDRLARYPTSFALSTAIPFYEYPQEAVDCEGCGVEADAAISAVSDRYFDVLGIGLTEGRAFTAEDRWNTEPVAIVSETLARRLAREGTVIGRGIRIPEGDGADAVPSWRTIVGVAGDVQQTYRDTDLDDVYIPFAQRPTMYAPVYFRSTDGPGSGVGILRAEVAAIDPGVLVTSDVTGFGSLAQQQARLLDQPRLLSELMTGFAVFAMLLAAFGMYGVTAYAVQQRVREIAIRNAIGATRRQVVALFVRDAIAVLACGVGAGLIGAEAIGKTLAPQLHGVQPWDWPTVLAASALIALATLLASWWPAARDTRSMDLMALLRGG